MQYLLIFNVDNHTYNILSGINKDVLENCRTGDYINLYHYKRHSPLEDDYRKIERINYNGGVKHILLEDKPV